MKSGTLQKKLLRSLNAKPYTKAIPITVSRYIEKGTPDILCVAFSVCIWIECKNPGEEPTPIQRKRLREWTDAGAFCWVAADFEETVEQFEKVYEMLESAYKSGL